MEIPRKKQRMDSPEPIKVTTLADLPAEILRKIIEPLDLEDRCQTRLCNRAMEEAVATSKWRVGRKAVKGENGVMEKQGVQVTIKNGDEGAVIHLHLNEKRVQADWSGRFRMCEMLLSSTLEICGDTYNSEKLHFINGLLDRCTANTLQLRLAPYQKLTSRTLNLIARAKDHVQIIVSHQSLTDKEFLSIPRPVAFDGSVNKIAFDSILAPGKDRVFLELLRRGHVFPTIFTSVISSNTLVEAIKIVSASHLANKMLIETPLGIGEYFVEFVSPEKAAADAVIDQFPIRRAVRTYRYQSAEIVLTTMTVMNMAGISTARFKINMD